MSILLNDRLAAKVRSAATRSDFLWAVVSSGQDGGRRLALGGTPARPLTAAEVGRLERQGSSADDWSKVLVAKGFDPARVRGSHFHGEVVLGAFCGQVRLDGGLAMPAGIYNSTVVNSVIGHDALVRHVKLLSNYAVGPGAALLDCGRITCDGPT